MFPRTDSLQPAVECSLHFPLSKSSSVEEKLGFDISKSL